MKILFLLLIPAALCAQQSLRLPESLPSITINGSGLVSGGGGADCEPDREPFDAKAYEICKVRGHVAAIENQGDCGLFFTRDAAFHLSRYVQSPKPETTPGYEHEEGEWHYCQYCHKMFRVVTTVKLEEK